jgi:hypothetical protein
VTTTTTKSAASKRKATTTPKANSVTKKKVIRYPLTIQKRRENVSQIARKLKLLP